MGPYCPLMLKPNRPAENNNILAAGEKVGQSGWGRKKKKKKTVKKNKKKRKKVQSNVATKQYAVGP